MSLYLEETLMKSAPVFLFIFFFFSPCDAFITRRDTRHVTIEFNHQPKDDKQRLDWVEGIKNAVGSVNNNLRRDGFLIPEVHPRVIESSDSWWKKASKYLTNLYHEVFFHQKAIAYPGKKNKAFIVRRNDELGSFSVYIPDGIPEKHFLEVLRKMISQHGIDASIGPDQHVVLSFVDHPRATLGYPVLHGLSFSLEALKEFKKDSDFKSLRTADRKLLAQRENKVLGPDVIQKTLLEGDSFHNDTQNDTQTKRLEIERKKSIAPYLFWWQSMPTTGLRLEEPFWPLAYPFLPHAFPLWQMAPKMGKGVKVFIVDTGIAAFDVIGKPEFKRNQDLQMQADFENVNYNLVSSQRSLLDKTEQLAQLVEVYTEKTKRNFKSIKKVLPKWITTYLSTYEEDPEAAVDPVRKYLLKNGRPEYINSKTQKLSSVGQLALNDIIHGELGIHPRGKEKPDYTLATLGAPNSQQKAILEFMPLVVAQEPFNLFSSSSQQLDKRWVTKYTTGHGTHTAGIIGGSLSSSIDSAFNKDSVTELLNKDTGICGIAPKCELVMIKAFKSSGFATNRSVVTQAIKKAQEQGAHILNLSLKIDDHLDTAEFESKSLQAALSGIPYISAASGNAQPNKMGVYQSDREGYPARFSNVAFDTGAFVLYKDKEDDYHCHIPEFSQYQEGVGPKFVAPGQNIFSCGIVPDQKESSMYMFLQGTSTAAPLLSGFSALLIAEFSGLFKSKEREKFLAICYSSGLRMEDSEDWKKKTLLGVLDFRTVLFKLHVLKNIKKILTDKTVFYTPKKLAPQKLHLEKDFDRLSEAIHMVVFGMAHAFAEEHNIGVKNNFENNFMGYFNSVRKLDYNPGGEIFSSFEKAIDFVTKAVLYGANKDSVSHADIQLVKKHIDQNVLKNLRILFTEEKVDMLGPIPDSAKRRIKGAYGTKLK